MRRNLTSLRAVLLGGCVLAGAVKLRTVPLWGLRTEARFMRELKSLSLDDA